MPPLVVEALGSDSVALVAVAVAAVGSGTVVAAAAEGMRAEV